MQSENSLLINKVIREEEFFKIGSIVRKKTSTHYENGYVLPEGSFGKIVALVEDEKYRETFNIRWLNIKVSFVGIDDDGKENNYELILGSNEFHRYVEIVEEDIIGAENDIRRDERNKCIKIIENHALLFEPHVTNNVRNLLDKLIRVIAEKGLDEEFKLLYETQQESITPPTIHDHDLVKQNDICRKGVTPSKENCFACVYLEHCNDPRKC